MRASLRAVYGIDLRVVLAEHTMSPMELADLVVWLPAGCAFWMSAGGPAALSREVRELRRVGFLLRVLEFRYRGSKGQKPKPDPEPVWEHERREQRAVMSRKAEAFLQRQGRR